MSRSRRTSKNVTEQLILPIVARHANLLLRAQILSLHPSSYDSRADYVTNRGAVPSPGTRHSSLAPVAGAAPAALDLSTLLR
jgi:hypothetical protein